MTSSDGRGIDRSLVTPLVLVGAYMVVVPLGRELSSVIPATPSSADWRFGAFGFFINALLLPVLGLTMLTVAGVLRNSRWLLLGSGAVSLALSVGLVVGFVAFYRDAAGLVAAAEASALPLFQTATRKTLAVTALTAPALLGLGVAAIRASRAGPGGASP